MKKRIFAFLSISLFLAACAAPQTSADTQTSPAPTILITTTPARPALTEIPGITSTHAATAAPQQPGVLTIRRLQMIDANVGWAEGSVTSEPDPSRFSDTFYYLLRTTDGGETWQDVTPPTPFTNTPGRGPGIGLFAMDANTAWATPVDNPFSYDPPYTLVWRTTDGGKSWKPSNPIVLSKPSRVKLSPWLQFVDEKHGWLTFHIQLRIESHDLQYRTSDGGISWEEIKGCYTFDGARQGCDVPQFTDAQTGWLMNVPEYTSTGDVDTSTIWRVQRTLDGGQTWQNIPLPASKEEKNCSQTFTRIMTGTVGMRVDCATPADRRESYYYLSADRGQTWRIIPLPGREFSLVPPIKIYETSGYSAAVTGNVFFLDMTTGWRLSAMDNGYQLEKTTDGGATWQKQADHLLWNDGFQFVDDNHGWLAIVDDYSAQPKRELQRTTDGGKTWMKLTPRLLAADPNKPAIARLETGHPLVIKSIRMVNSLNGWAIGANGYVFHTIDGGKAWQDVTPRYGQIIADRGFLVLDTKHAWTTMAGLGEGVGTIWSTEDGGQTWRPTNASSIDFTLLGEKIRFRTGPIERHTLEEFLSGSAVLTISKTTDGGKTWQLVNLPKMVLSLDEISLTKDAYPDDINELMRDTLDCDETALHAFSSDTVGLRVVCRGAYREVPGTYGYSFLLIEYYLSTDSGASWNNWMSVGDDLPAEYDTITPTESEFFLPGGIGWRLKANQLLQTMDGGKTWTTLKAVGWDEVQLDFINTQEGWAIARDGHATALVHTTDGGRIWEELKPLVGNE